MVCICTTAGKLSSDFFKKNQRLCRGQKHLKITPSRKPRCPSPSIRGTFLLFPFSTLLSRRLSCSAAYFRTSSIIFMLQKCGPHMEQKCAVFACGNVSSWEFASGFGIGCGVGGMFVQNIWFFVFLHARRLIASNEDRQLPFRAEAAQCLQGRSCLHIRRLGSFSGNRAGVSRLRHSELGDSVNCPAHNNRTTDRACSGLDVRADTGRTETHRNCRRDAGDRAKEETRLDLRRCYRRDPLDRSLLPWSLHCSGYRQSGSAFE